MMGWIDLGPKEHFGSGWVEGVEMKWWYLLMIVDSLHSDVWTIRYRRLW